MADPLYGLTAEDVRFLRELKRKETTGENVPRPRYQRKQLPFRYDDVKWAKTGSAIPARSGVALGSGEVTIQQVNDDDEFEETEETKSVLNAMSSEVAADTYILIGLVGKKWFPIVEDCGA
jgi:hypothetical protein